MSRSTFLIVQMALAASFHKFAAGNGGWNIFRSVRLCELERNKMCGM